MWERIIIKIVGRSGVFYGAENPKFSKSHKIPAISETEKHNLLLSQYLIDDTHNTLIVDNAKSELLLNYKWS